MEYKIFLRLLMTYKKSEEHCHEYSEFGIDLHEGKYPIAPYLYELMKAGFESTYTKEGIDWIDWWIFENEYGQKDWGNIPRIDEVNPLISSRDGKPIKRTDDNSATDKDGNPIAYSYESLYELLESEYKLL